MAIVTGLTEKYEKDGYARPRISIDDGLVSHGVLRLYVAEARLGAIEILGDPGPYRSTLERLGTELQTDQALKRDELQLLMRRLQALRGLTLNATTSRDALAPDAYRLSLDTDFEPIDGSLRITNRGTNEIGPNFLLGRVQAHGLFSGRSSIGLLFGAASDYEEYRGAGVSADIAVGSHGSRFSMSGFRSRSDPREEGLDREDRYVRDRATIEIRRPVTETPTRILTLTAAFSLEDLQIDRARANLRDERLRMLELGANWVWRSDDGVQQASALDLVKGLSGFGSGLYAPDLTNDPRRHDFALTMASYTALVQWTDRWSVRIDGFAQFTNHVLPYSERFKIGGDRLGRGFEVAEIAGDRGIGSKVELRRSLSRAPAAFGRTSVYLFYDLAAAWKNDRPGRESAATTGVGYAVRGTKLSGHLELAKPLTHGDVEGNKDLSVFLDITYRL